MGRKDRPGGRQLGADQEPTIDLDGLRRRQGTPASARGDETVDVAKGDWSRRNAPTPRLEWPARDRAEAATMRRPSPDNSQSVLSDDQTRLVGAPSTSNDLAAASGQAVPSNAGSGRDPVVGWLVITAGPGLGRSLELGVGANSIGRSEQQKVRLDFGDQHISRDKHAIVIFDPKHRQFFVERGDARNLVYLGGELLLTVRELKSADVISIGDTQLTFVPFCGPNFSWQ
jgi:hypothetical protein